jgi:chorismate mutase
MRTNTKVFTAIVLAVFSGLPATASASTVAPHHALRDLASHSAERIETASLVAAAKFGTEKPIDDPEREKQVLDKVSADGAAKGLDPAYVRVVFTDQIEANKQVQRHLFALWTADPAQAPAERPDLAAIRPVIDRLNTEIVEALATAAPVRTSRGCLGKVGGAEAIAAAKHRLRPVQRVSLGYSLRHFCAPTAKP